MESQIWIAVSVYMPVAIVRKRPNRSRSLYAMLQVVSLNLLEGTPLGAALSRPATSPESSMDGKQLILFR